jgi:hypothetical protein
MSNDDWQLQKAVRVCSVGFAGPLTSLSQAHIAFVLVPKSFGTVVHEL